MSKPICKLRGPLFSGQILIKIIDRNDLFPYTCVEYINVLYFLLKLEVFQVFFLVLSPVFILRMGCFYFAWGPMDDV